MPPQRPDIDAERLAALLDDADWSVEWLERVDSTNAVLLAAADDPDVRGPELVVAEEQTAGRGRFDRAWTSPRGAGLTFSLLLRPAAPVGTWGWLPLLTGVALAETVRELTGVDAVLKWPNDLLAPDGRKLAGILVQAAGGAAVLGIGLNVSTTADELPVDTASSLAMTGAPPVDRTALLAATAQRVLVWARRFDDAAGDADACGLTTAYATLCGTLGREVSVANADGTSSTGVAAVVAADGALVLHTADGERVVHAGDVHHLRA